MVHLWSFVWLVSCIFFIWLFSPLLVLVLYEQKSHENLSILLCTLFRCWLLFPAVEKVASHTSHLYGFNFSWIAVKCTFKWLLIWKVFGHILHFNVPGNFLCTMFVCWTTSCFLENVCSHSSHLWGLNFSCIALMWWFRIGLVPALYGHMAHWKFLILWCTLSTWFFIFFFQENILPHSSHLYGFIFSWTALKCTFISHLFLKALWHIGQFTDLGIFHCGFYQDPKNWHESADVYINNIFQLLNWSRKSPWLIPSELTSAEQRSTTFLGGEVVCKCHLKFLSHLNHSFHEWQSPAKDNQGKVQGSWSSASAFLSAPKNEALQRSPFRFLSAFTCLNGSLLAFSIDSMV